jgi:excisionase family DNA binding protein
MERLTYTIAEVAQLLGISRSKAYELVAEGLLPVIPLPGRRKLVARAVVERLVEPADHRLNPDVPSTDCKRAGHIAPAAARTTYGHLGTASSKGRAAGGLSAASGYASPALADSRDPRRRGLLALEHSPLGVGVESRNGGDDPNRRGSQEDACAAALSNEETAGRS